MEKFITSTVVAKIAGVTPKTVNLWARLNKLPSIKANEGGKRVRYLFNESQIRTMFTD